MTIIAILHIACSCAALPVMRPDTPPALPIPVAKLAELKTMEDVIAVTLLENGARAPSGIRLPELLNRRQTISFMHANYPREMRDSAAKLTPLAWVNVDRLGKVRRIQLVQQSGYAALDSLSVGALRVASFRPALLGDDSVGVWVPLPARVPPYEELTAALNAPLERWEAPVETPFTVAPKLLNRNQVEAAIIRIITSRNPIVLEMNEAFARSQRVGGTTEMWVYIDAQGAVANALIKKTSGHPDLDASAEQIARMMRFSPAKNENKPVDVWIQIPIEFRDRRR